MRKLYWIPAMAAVFVLCLFFPQIRHDGGAVFAQEELGRPVQETGPAEPSKTPAKELPPPKDDRVAAMSRDYAAALAALRAKLEAVDDPADRDQLQREIHDLKAEEEIAVMETLLLVATEKDDEERIAELQKALDFLYSPVKAQPLDDGAAQPIEAHGFRNTVRKLQPDDAQ